MAARCSAFQNKHEAIDLWIKCIEYFLKMLQCQGLSFTGLLFKAANLEIKYYFCTFDGVI